MISIRDAEQAIYWIEKARGHTFDLVIAGRVFGGRRGEAPLCPLELTILDQGFSFTFGDGHRMEISQPDGVKQPIQVGGTEQLVVLSPAVVNIGSDGALLIASADEARFGWHCYGRPQTEENWCTEIYRLRDVAVEHVVSGPTVSVDASNYQERSRYPGGSFVCLAPTVGTRIDLTAPKPAGFEAVEEDLPGRGGGVNLQEQLERYWEQTRVEYDLQEGYPVGDDLYYECPQCQHLLWSLAGRTEGARCKCGYLSFDHDYGRFIIRNPQRQPALIRLTPKRDID